MRLDSTHSQDRKTYRTTKELQTSYVAVGNLKGDDVLATRSASCLPGYVRESQAGFRAGKSTADGVFFTRMMCERSLLGNWTYSAALLDFSGAFDTLIRETALNRLAQAQAETRTITTLISNTTARVKLNHHISHPFETNVGVVQGDLLSPVMH